MNNAETIGFRLKAIRKLRGMTQAELAEQIFAKDSTISDYENDKHDITAKTLMLLAEVLEVKVGYFFGEVKIEEYMKENIHGSNSIAIPKKVLDRDLETMNAVFGSIVRQEVRKVCIETVKEISRL